MYFWDSTETIKSIVTVKLPMSRSYNKELHESELKRVLKMRKYIHFNGIDWSILKHEKFFFAFNTFDIGTILKNTKENDFADYFIISKHRFISQCARLIVYVYCYYINANAIS